MSLVAVSAAPELARLALVRFASKEEVGVWHRLIERGRPLWLIPILTEEAALIQG